MQTHKSGLLPTPGPPTKTSPEHAVILGRSPAHQPTKATNAADKRKFIHNFRVGDLTLVFDVDGMRTGHGGALQVMGGPGSPTWIRVVKISTAPLICPGDDSHPAAGKVAAV